MALTLRQALVEGFVSPATGLTMTALALIMVARDPMGWIRPLRGLTMTALL